MSVRVVTTSERRAWRASASQLPRSTTTTAGSHWSKSSEPRANSQSNINHREQTQPSMNNQGLRWSHRPHCLSGWLSVCLSVRPLNCRPGGLEAPGLHQVLGSTGKSAGIKRRKWIPADFLRRHLEVESSEPLPQNCQKDFALSAVFNVS